MTSSIGTEIRTVVALVVLQLAVLNVNDVRAHVVQEPADTATRERNNYKSASVIYWA